MSDKGVRTLKLQILRLQTLSQAALIAVHVEL